MSENITLDPEYANLILEVNKLKDELAEKLMERDWLAYHVIPEIENNYLVKIGLLENDAFMENLKLLKINRKIEIYKEMKKSKQKISDKELENMLDAEFGELEEDFKEMQEDLIYSFDDEFEDSANSEFVKLINILYKTLIKKLSPLINSNNTRMENQLYELLEKSYRELDLTIMSKLQTICEHFKSESNFIIGDVKTLTKIKNKYLELINENDDIILNIKSSDSFEKKRILDDDNLMKKTKEEINKEIAKTSEKIKKAEKEWKKLRE